MNTIALVGNIRARRRIVRLDPPMPGTAAPQGATSPARPGPAVWRLPGAWVSIGAVAALVLVTAGFVAAQAQRGDDGAVVEAGRMPVTSLQEGDCFDMADGEVSDVQVMPCDDAHDAEVFFNVDYSATAGAAFPSEDERLEFAERSCIAMFTGYVGIPYEESALGMYWLEPTRRSWDQGDRRFTCAAVAWDGTKLSGSVRGSGR